MARGQEEPAGCQSTYRSRWFLHDTLMPRYPGTPAPSWPGTFLLWACRAPSLGFFLGSQVVQAATDKVHLTSPRRSTRNSQVRPPHGPPPALSVRAAQIIHEQAKAGQGKDGATGMIFQSALHCTVSRRGWTPPQKEKNQSISLPTFLQSSYSSVCSLSPNLIRQWQSHPSLAPGLRKRGGDKRHQWPRDWDQQKSLVLISAPGGRPLFLPATAQQGRALVKPREHGLAQVLTRNRVAWQSCLGPDTLLHGVAGK